MSNKIAILGTAPLSVDLAPFADMEWDIWACSPGNAYGRLPRITEFFELHALREMQAPENKAMSTPYYAWLRGQSFPVWMQEKNEYVTQACEYPLKAMIAKFGRTWFSSSIAYMLAFAITRGAKEIAIFGVDMAHETEHYTAQKAGCLRFIEIAKERGITVSVPDESCLGRQPPIYGYNEASHMGRRLNAMMATLQKQRAHLNAEVDRMMLERSYVDGALSNMAYMIRTWVDGEDAHFGIDPELPQPKSMDHRLDDFKPSSGGVFMPAAQQKYDPVQPFGVMADNSFEKLEKAVGALTEAHASQKAALGDGKRSRRPNGEAIQEA